MEAGKGLSDRPLRPFGANLTLTSDSPAQNIPECAQWPEMAARFLRTVL